MLYEVPQSFLNVKASSLPELPRCVVGEVHHKGLSIFFYLVYSLEGRFEDEELQQILDELVSNKERLESLEDTVARVRLPADSL